MVVLGEAGCLLAPLPALLHLKLSLILAERTRWTGRSPWPSVPRPTQSQAGSALRVLSMTIPAWPQHRETNKKRKKMIACKKKNAKMSNWNVISLVITWQLPSRPSPKRHRGGHFKIVPGKSNGEIRIEANVIHEWKAAQGLSPSRRWDPDWRRQAGLLRQRPCAQAGTKGHVGKRQPNLREVALSKHCTMKDSGFVSQNHW